MEKPMLQSRSGILRFKAGLMKTLDNHIGESTPGTLLSKKKWWIQSVNMSIIGNAQLMDVRPRLFPTLR